MDLPFGWDRVWPRISSGQSWWSTLRITARIRMRSTRSFFTTSWTTSIFMYLSRCWALPMSSFFFFMIIQWPTTRLSCFWPGSTSWSSVSWIGSTIPGNWSTTWIMTTRIWSFSDLFVFRSRPIPFYSIPWMTSWSIFLKSSTEGTWSTSSFIISRSRSVLLSTTSR